VEVVKMATLFVQKSETVAEAWREVQEAFRDAEAYVAKVETGVFPDDTEATLDDMVEARELLHNMYESWTRSIGQIVFTQSDYDGDLRLWRDGYASFGFVYTKSGYTGAIIFHRRRPGHDDLGTWSVHT
jgi:hypothetical protein